MLTKQQRQKPTYNVNPLATSSDSWMNRTHFAETAMLLVAAVKTPWILPQESLRRSPGTPASPGSQGLDHQSWDDEDEQCVECDGDPGGKGQPRGKREDEEASGSCHQQSQHFSETMEEKAHRVFMHNYDKSVTNDDADKDGNAAAAADINVLRATMI